MEVRAIVHGAKKQHNRFTREAATIGPRTARVVRHHTMLLNTRVKARASGRPGPNAPTGDYRRSIASKFEQQGDTYVGIVGTAKPQGRRLELGFVGADRLGRVYNQPPYPHFRPAHRDTREAFLLDLRALVTRRRT